MLGKQKQMGRWIAIAVAMGLVWSPHVSAQKPPRPPKEEPVTYRMVELSSMNGHTYALNQLDGAVELVGFVYDDSGDVQVMRGYYWIVDPAGNVLSIDLPTLPPSKEDAIVHSMALGVNNDGVVVGSQYDDISEARTPLLWPDAASDPIELPLPEGTVGARATSINDAGIVVGCAYNPDYSSSNLVAWKVALIEGEWVVQDTLTVENPTDAFDFMLPKVVNSGYVAATLSFRDPFDRRALRLMLDWNDDQVWDVDSSWTQLFDCYSFADGMNNAGTICGDYTCPTNGRHAYLMTATGELSDLPVLPSVKMKGITYSATSTQWASGLNNAPSIRIVGSGRRSYTQGNFQHWEPVALRWDGVSSVTDLRTVTDGSPALYAAYDINDAGWITARTDVGGQPALPVVLIPKP